MTALEQLLIRQIAATGPITLADYMAACLMHPEHGYYTTRDPFGRAGDFTTAPEISQMFGEVLGLCLAQAWMDQGSPSEFALAELGPGRGTLMADILRATQAVPGFHTALSLHLVEGSDVLRNSQQAALPGQSVTWHANMSDLPIERPLFLIANEFFDALPVRQLRRAEGDQWCEHMIGLDDQGALTSGWSAEKSTQTLAHRLDDTKEGDLVETSPQTASISQEIGSRIAQNGGVALIIDYGDWRALGDTVQALRGHEPQPILTSPGQADLSAHVDFETIARAAPCAFTRLTPQGVLLERLGITARAQALAKRLSGEALDQHIGAHRRLTHPQEMGTLFKAMALFPEGHPPPPGLET